jgi:hypothetical protein
MAIQKKSYRDQKKGDVGDEPDLPLQVRYQEK